MATPEAGGRPRTAPTLYHIADVRLGGAFPFLGEGGSAHRALVRETFVRAVDQALALAPSAVLITGNLFGTPFPPRDLAEFARAQIARLTGAGAAVLVAAGPLDALHDRNYAAGALAGLERVTVFPPVPKVVVLSDLEVTVVGVSWATSAAAPADFLSGLTIQPAGRHLVGAGYLDWPRTDEAMRALRRQIAATGAAYLALGGAPVRRDLSTDGVAAWCPGSPELVAPEEGDGAPLVVRLDGRAEVTPRPVARRRFARFTLQPAAYATADDLAAAIRALGDPQLAAVVRLVGPSRIDQHIDTATLRERLSDAFLALDVVDESCPTPEDLATAPYPDLSVAGKFVAVARREMERATTEEARRRVGAALRLGLALLAGRGPS
jgi:DNA repair exonuclease SbcCD nuclease subunit